MALFEVDFPDDFLSELTDVSFEMIAEEALTEAAPVLEESMKKSAAGVIEHGNPSDSEMVKSIKASKPKATKTDAWIVNVGPRGYSNHTYHAQGRPSKRAYKVSNALKAIWKEYGIAHPGHFQPPRPFIERATKDASDEVAKRLQEVYDRKTGAT